MKSIIRTVFAMFSFVFVAVGASFLSHVFGSILGNGSAHEAAFIPEAHADDPPDDCTEHAVCSTGTTGDSCGCSCGGI